MPEGAAKTQKSYEVPFPLLSDPDAKVHDAYRVSNTLSAGGIAKLKLLGIDVERWSKRKHRKIAIPSVFLIDQDGTVKFAHAAHDHRTRPSTKMLMERLAKP